MAVGDHGETTDDFVESSYLTYIVPARTDVSIEELFSDAEDAKSAFDSIEQRQSLFFDETVDVLLILRTPWADEQTLRSYLGRLVIQLEAQVVNAATAGRDSPPAADVIFTGALEDSDDPFILVDDGEGDDSEADEEGGEKGASPAPRKQHVYAVWKLPVFLGRPRIRLQGPAVVFAASASFKPVQDAIRPMGGGGGGSGYLPSGVPSGFNLLESLGSDPALHGVKPRLSALRVSRVAPLTQPKDLMRPIRALPNLRVDIFPVAHTRVRFSRPNTVPTSAALIALLEVDFTPFFACPLQLEHVRLAIAGGGTVENLCDGVPGLALPLTCGAHDHVTFLYRLAPEQLDLLASSAAGRQPSSSHPTRHLEIAIEATVQVRPDFCTPRLVMAWTTTLDFTLPVNPGFGGGAAATMQPIQRAHRPSQLSISGNESLTSPAVSRPDALPSLEAATTRTETTIPDLGITMTFVGPEGSIRAGDVFTWTVYVVNRTSADKFATTAAPARKLALMALPRRRRNDVRILRPPSASLSGQPRRAPDGREVADAVLDENIVHAMQRSSLVDATDVICLSADTRVGPLAPGACHVVELKFLALREGIVGVEAIRVIDLGSQEHVDVRELPIMVVEGRREEEGEGQE